MAPRPGCWPVLREGSRGSVPLIIQKAFVRQGYRYVRPSGVWGPGMARALRVLQDMHGLTVSGVYGPKTHELCVKLEYFTERESKALANWLKVTTERCLAQRLADAVIERRRKVQMKISAQAELMIRYAPFIHYTQGGMRMQGVRDQIRSPRYPKWEDCSSAATYLSWQAGAPDPNGRGYDLQGYTGTLSKQGISVPAFLAEPGDLVFYGRGWPWGHVAVVIEGSGMSAVCFSHGSESGPHRVPIGYRPIGQVRRYKLSD